MAKRCVVIGMLGVQLDQPRRARDQWAAWRASVAICHQDDLVVDRFEMLVDRCYTKLADQVVPDIHRLGLDSSTWTWPATSK